MINLIDFIRSVLVAVIWSVMENRYFYEGPLGMLCIEGPFFKIRTNIESARYDYSTYNLVDWIYHFKIYHWLMSTLFIVASFSTNTIQWVMNMLLMPLLVDFLWFVWERRRWHRDDWSNIGGFPLILGLFAWYWLVGIICLILGIYLMVM